jgi:tRNA pseudouridine32 synthase/23S rRNA pseudouridine746 synthase
LSASNPELVYQDESLLVVNKPAGLLAVPGRGADKQDCLSARLQKEFPDALVVHRLDMATSGLMMFARGAETQRSLSHMFRERKMDKRYIALVQGRVEPPSGEVNLPIAADWPNRPMRKIDADMGKPSLTRYRVLGYKNEVASTLLRDDQCPPLSITSRLELEPVTGRTHQLRIHMADIGHPVLGDALYGAEKAGRMMLHACSLRFHHPATGMLLDFQCEAPF